MGMKSIFTKCNIETCLKGCKGITKGKVTQLKSDDKNMMNIKLDFFYQENKYSAVGNFLEDEDMKTTVEKTGQLVLGAILPSHSDKNISFSPQYERIYGGKQIMEVL